MSDIPGPGMGVAKLDKQKAMPKKVSRKERRKR
jgi:hypothetical protein